jgi:hypothetical protein
MGLSGPIRTIAASAQHAHPACGACVHAGHFALQPRVVCAERGAVHFKDKLYAAQPACDRYVARIGRDPTLHVRSRNEEVR